MPRKSLGPRLYLRKDKGENVYIIRDRFGDIRTGYNEFEREMAESVLASYIAGKFRSKTKTNVGFIYFVTCMSSTNYPIKIGFSATPMEARMTALQIGNPNLLVVVATFPGTLEDEQLLHARFRRFHIRGEWFTRSDEIVEYIGGLPGHAEAYGAEEF